MKASAQSRIFISYSHRGNGPEWKAWLVRHLSVFEQHHLLDVWQDGKIRVSAEWNDDIRQAMSSASLALFLLTPEALESEFILRTELPFLCDRWQRERIPVFPVVCEPCPWKEQEQARWLHAIQSPAGAEPLSSFPDAVADRHLRELATSIARELSRVALYSLSATDVQRAEVRGETKAYLDKFPLTRGPGLREEKLIGREQELALLDLAFAQPHTAIVSLVAWGGVGKTMLVQHWLQRLQRESWFGAWRIYAWSFYSQGTKEDRQASEDSFLAHALEWFGVQCEPTLSPWDKGRLLADAVAQERTVLLLDGIEPLQYPPGPMGGQLRAPGVQSLLKHLARKANAINSQLSTFNQALCLVTTREPLTDLTDFQRREGSPWGSVLRLDLGNLTDEAGAALLHHAGANRAGAAEIKPDDKELLAASREVDGHALTLNLLGRFLARAHGGDIRRRDKVRFEEADRNEQGGTTFKMLAAFENWFANEGDIEARSLTILRLLGLFDRPADEGCMAALRKPPVIFGLTEPLFTLRRDLNTGQTAEQALSNKAWNDGTHFLADFGLVAIQADADIREHLLDCHPLIREHFAKALHVTNPDAWKTAHCRLYDYLRDNSEYQPFTVLRLQPLYNAIAHGCSAGCKEEAFRLYHERVLRGAKNFSWTKLGTFGADLQAIAAFFDKPWTRSSTELSSNTQAWLQNQAGFYLRATGRLLEAIDAMRLAVDLAAKLQTWINACKYASNLSELEITLGDLRAARRDAEISLTFARQSGDWRAERRDCTAVADALFQAGDRHAAFELFREAENAQAVGESMYPMLYSLPGFRYGELLLNVVERLAWSSQLGQMLRVNDPISNGANRVWEPMLRICREVDQRFDRILSWYETGGWGGLLDFGLGHLARSRAMLYFAELNDSESEVTKARHIAYKQVIASLDGIRRAGTQHHIPRALLTRAWLRIMEGDADGARADLDEAWDIAERGPMRLHLADIHLHRARLLFRKTPYPWTSPQHDLAAAEKLINDLWLSTS